MPVSDQNHTDNAAKLPLVDQISEMLVRDIHSGVLPDGERLPPERTMAQNLGISVGTLRKALGRLESQNLLRRVQGSGNYVQCKPDISNIYALFRLEHIDGPSSPTARLLSCQRVNSKPANLPVHSAAAHAFRFRRLRYLNDTHAAVEEIWLDGRYGEQINQDELGHSLYQFYREHLDCRITRTEDRVSVDTLPSWTPTDFHPQLEDHWGFIERISRDQNGLIAEYSHTWFNPEQIRFVAR